MSATSNQPTLRQQVNQLLVSAGGRGVSLSRLYELLPSLTSLQVRGVLKKLVSTGAAIRHGSLRHPVYQSVLCVVPESVKPDPAPTIPRASAKPAPVPATVHVHWPDGLQVKVAPTSHRKIPFYGTDWSGSMLRNGCQDHLLVPSRRGDVRVAHQGPMGICGARNRREPAEKGSNP